MEYWVPLSSALGLSATVLYGVALTIPEWSITKDITNLLTDELPEQTQGLFYDCVNNKCEGVVPDSILNWITSLGILTVLLAAAGSMLLTVSGILWVWLLWIGVSLLSGAVLIMYAVEKTGVLREESFISQAGQSVSAQVKDVPGDSWYVFLGGALASLMVAFLLGIQYMKSTKEAAVTNPEPSSDDSVKRPSKTKKKTKRKK
jgi:hypothetical protein